MTGKNAATAGYFQAGGTALGGVSNTAGVINQNKSALKIS
jgi:hypothetical protein